VDRPPCPSGDLVVQDPQRLQGGLLAADGGTVLISFFSGIVDPDDRIRLGGYPAPWRGLLGLRVEEFGPLPEGAVVPLDGEAGANGDERRAVRRGDHLFLISHLDRPVELDLGGKSLDLLTSDIVGPSVVLGPRGVLVLTARD
jgi:hypothetical protein